VPRRLSRTKRLLMTTGAVVAVAGVLPGAASAAECAAVPTSKAFAQFGDANDYFLAPGGAFDSIWSEKSGTPNLVANENPFNLGGGVTSLRMTGKEAVTSAQFCVDRTMPHLRFVALHDDDGQLDVEVKIYENGRVMDSSSGSIAPSDHRSWAPTRTVDLKTGGMAEGESRTATVRLRSQGEWYVDDLFIDPYRR